MAAFLKVFDLIPGFVWAALLLAALAGCTFYAFEANVAEARLAGSRAEFASYREELERSTRQAIQEARTREVELATTNERLTHESQTRIAQLETRIADLGRTTGSLRNTIAALNARATPANPSSITYFDEARTARELLGDCAQAYSDVAGGADALRDQVTGLQEYATKVCRP